MYLSKEEIHIKLSQVKYLYETICKFDDKIFVNNGMDVASGADILETHMSSFVAQARSIFQYAHKEINNQENGEKVKNQKIYEDFVSKTAIIKIFKGLRNSDIHESAIRTSTTIYLSSPIKIPNSGLNNDAENTSASNPDAQNNTTKEQDNTNKKSVHRKLLKKTKVTDQIIKDLTLSGENEILKTKGLGDFIYEVQKIDEEDDLFNLCQLYVESIESFIELGETNGFIS